MDGLKLEQRHGKARVRVGRTWRETNGINHFVEWNVSISLLSDCLPAYTHADNSDIVATDTMKNTVYVKAKESKQLLSLEDFAILLGKHFTSYYPQVTAAIVNIIEKPWERIHIDDQPHDHGFKLGSEKHTTEVTVKKCGAVQVISGIEGLALLKTTQTRQVALFKSYSEEEVTRLISQLENGRSANFDVPRSGFEKFIRDKYTILPETRERMMATEVTASWRYTFEALESIPANKLYFTEKYNEVKKVLVNTFFGPVKGGVYSPSVQSTLYDMAKAVLARVPEVLLIQLKMPNIHFLPVNLSSKDNPVIVKFEDDVYLPTDEPHGSIQATLSRIQSKM